MPSETLPIVGMWFQTVFVLFSVYSEKIGMVFNIVD
ncbi:universal stress protein UspA [Neisseria meningitidis]|nr:universal stress protein UspA [Neisseria meningitidis]MBW8006784.1 universal stress protein UspA [Neisseria meningitidis]